MSSLNRPIKALGETYLTKEGMTFHEISDVVCSVTEKKAPRNWWIAFFIASTFTGILGAAIGYLFWQGIGVWGNNAPVYWAWDITNFVWWIGIGHAGTLISAVLFIFRQKWRTAINRAAEAMTIFAVICALMFPGIHVGRIWFAYYMFPLPNQMAIWPNFKSPLIWDLFAVSTYFTVSLLFWYSGLIPDFALLRDRSMGMKGRAGRIRRLAYGFLSLGWRGSNRHWQNYERMYLILAALSTPLVLSVHSVVSFDFATAVLPGWHTTIFPPYFVAGAVFSGFAMVMTLMDLELMNKIMLVTGSLVGYSYAMEFFIAAYSGNPYEKYVFFNRAFGPYKWAYWTMISCNVISPQFFWFKKLRTNVAFMFVISILINIGMWFERFVIIVSSLQRDFLPSSWGYFRPTLVDMAIYSGTLGFFFTCFLLFIRWVPMVAIAEVKGVMPEANPHDESHEHESEHEAAPHGRDAALVPGE
jgi:Ni/Fe-hydrogenase subunit HybB-like protein